MKTVIALAERVMIVAGRRDRRVADAACSTLAGRRQRRSRRGRRASWPPSSNTAPAATTTARRPAASASKASRRRASPDADCSRRPCASCAGASCRRPAPSSRTARRSTRWSPGSKHRSTGLPTQAHMPDQVVLHRLNRKEYANAVRDLLAVDVDARRTAAAGRRRREGFDNIASALQVSPSFIEQYVIAARAVAVKAIGRPDARPGGLDVPRRTRHAAHARARTAARHARRHSRESRSAVRRRIPSSTSPTWPPTSGATAWSSRTRWS